MIEFNNLTIGQMKNLTGEYASQNPKEKTPQELLEGLR